ncbi:DNA alkylation repair enzyme [Saccharicrinis carchari]|uniref:DNA alkylation repair enzyme n=1 Tax=Saccharicrinis carchari TaxID=1168039 RepID=A0A521EIC3_SACCC|nr:DNA alkylation repair protein [Saccharicrinis carchari]SMO83677.1 DNA alkylation repair enzyme [Saccharicrinis carchari]
MKFFLQDDISDKVDQIIKHLNKLMDGNVSAQMKDFGLEYKLNYGASLMWLRELSEKYGHNNQLANRLWHRQIRETMLMATFIADAPGISEERVEEWGESLQHNEIAEQMGVNLLWQLSFLEALALNWLSSDSKYKQSAIWAALAVFVQQGGIIEDAVLNKYLQAMEDSFQSTGAFALRVQGRFLRSLCRKSSNYVSKIEQFIDKISERPNAAWLVEDVKTEIEFLKTR